MLPGPKRTPKSTSTVKQLIVFLHGYGSNGDFFNTISDQWSQVLPEAEFIAPHGLEPLNEGPSSYRWFPWIDFDANNVRRGLAEAAPVLAKIITHWLHERKLTTENLALVGFSQGMMIALEMMFHLPGIRAIIGYSGAFYPPASKSLSAPFPNILLVHGEADSGVPFHYCLEARQELSKLGITPQLETRPALDHQIDEKGIHLGASFLHQIFLS
jgi:phospholipase/carboxylesterase